MYDVIVVGAGPAGMTAALYALRNGKSALVIEKGGIGGQITFSPKVENIPGFQSLSGNEFADKFMEQILAQGAELELDRVTGLEPFEADGKPAWKVKTEYGGDFEARAVVLALGVKHRMLGLPGESELGGEGISFCAVCDGDFYTDRTVCVAGGGNSALQEAVLLAGKCKKVIMLQDLPTFTGEARLQEVLFAHDNVEKHVNMKITGIRTENGKITAITAKDVTTDIEQDFPCDGFFEAIGLIPENDDFKGFADLNKFGYFDSGEDCLTKTPGLYVAGDCRSKFIRQVTTACGDGAIAALAACRYIDTL